MTISPAYRTAAGRRRVEKPRWVKQTVLATGRGFTIRPKRPWPGTAPRAPADAVGRLVGSSGAPGIDGKSEGPARTGRAAAGGARCSRSLAPGPRVTPLSSPVAAKGSGARGGPVNSVPKSCPSPSWLVAGPHVPASFATRCGHRTKPEPLPDSATCGQGPEPGQAALASVLCEDGRHLAECFCASTSCF